MGEPEVDPNATQAFNPEDLEKAEASLTEATDGVDADAKRTFEAVEAEVDPNATRTFDEVAGDVDPNATRTFDEAVQADVDPNATRTFDEADADAVAAALPADEPEVVADAAADPVVDAPTDVTEAVEAPTTDATESIKIAPAFPPVHPWDPEEEPVDGTKKKSRKGVWALLGAVVLFGAYGGVATAFADKVPTDTSISGVQVGGLDRDQAVKKLSDALDPDLKGTKTLKVGDETTKLDPASIDLAMDYEETLDDVVGFSLDPRRLLAHFTGGQNLNASISVNESKLSDAVAKVAAEFKAEPKDATLTMSGTKPTVTKAVQGVVVDEAASIEKIKTEWMNGKDTIELEATTTDPAITDAAMTEFVDKTVTPMLASPVSVTVKDKLVEINPDEIAAFTTFAVKDGKLAAVIDPAKLEEVVAPDVKSILSGPKDAQITIVNHTTPTITPGMDGEAIDYDKLASAVQTAGTSSNRTAAAEIVIEGAKTDVAALEKMGVKEIVSEIKTPLTADNVRTTNLVVGTSKINNTLVKPGETFSLTQGLGPIDYEHGFVDSGVVANGFNSTALGGGLSQLSTNTFNIGYRAGMEDVEHRAHSKYFERYPMGLEATLWTGSIDMRWKNTTPYGALIETWVADGYVHTRLWSTKYYDVEVWQGQPYAFTKATTKLNTARDCEPSPPGASGFTVKVGRKVSLNGSVVEDSSITWTYQPVNGARCS